MAAKNNVHTLCCKVQSISKIFSLLWGEHSILLLCVFRPNSCYFVQNRENVSGEGGPQGAGTPLPRLSLVPIYQVYKLIRVSSTGAPNPPE